MKINFSKMDSLLTLLIDIRFFTTPQISNKKCKMKRLSCFIKYRQAPNQKQLVLKLQGKRQFINLSLIFCNNTSIDSMLEEILLLSMLKNFFHNEKKIQKGKKLIINSDQSKKTNNRIPPTLQSRNIKDYIKIEGGEFPKFFCQFFLNYQSNIDTNILFDLMRQAFGSDIKAKIFLQIQEIFNSSDCGKKNPKQLLKSGSACSNFKSRSQPIISIFSSFQQQT